MFLDQARLDQLVELLEDALEATGTLQSLINLNDGEPIEWAMFSRERFLKDATLLAWLTSLDIACYPLSDSSVVFYGEPTCP